MKIWMTKTGEGNSHGIPLDNPSKITKKQNKTKKERERERINDPYSFTVHVFIIQTLIDQHMHYALKLHTKTQSLH
jgi:hypothetical protein